MPNVAIRLAESAVEDLEKIREWYSDQGSPDVGDRFTREIFKRIETLRDHPDLGRVVSEFDQSSLRELIHPPFRIVYRREPETIRVVRVWRSERLFRLPPGPREGS